MDNVLALVKHLTFKLYSSFCLVVSFFVPAKDNVWIVASHSGLVGNARFFAEYILEHCETSTLSLYLFHNNDAGKLTEDYFLTKYRGRVKLYKKRSMATVVRALQARYLFISHDVVRDVGFPLASRKGRRTIVNLWHGIAMKKHWLSKKERFSNHKSKAKQFSAVVASSAADAVAKAAVFQKPLEDIWITGSPRNDILVRHTKLPDDLYQQEQNVLAETQGKTLIMYAPTWRSYQDDFLPFDKHNLAQLSHVLTANHAVLGLRLHEKDEVTFQKLYDMYPSIINLGQKKYPETQVLLRNTQLLITDYSSIWLDYLLTNKPVLAYWHDFEQYQQRRGTLWNIAEIFPGPQTFTCANLVSAIENILVSNMQLEPNVQQKYNFIKSLFHLNCDGKSTERLLHQIVEKNGGVIHETFIPCKKIETGH